MSRVDDTAEVMVMLMLRPYAVCYSCFMLPTGSRSHYSHDGLLLANLL